MTEGRLDLAAVREQLNELTFEHGTRKLAIGLVPDLFIDQSPDEVARALQRIDEQLAQHDLSFEHATDVPDQLVVVQHLKHREGDPDAMARAVQWVSRITTVALEMVIPAVVGAWLDRRFETSFLALIGLFIGVPLGLWHLIRMTKK